MTDSTDDSSPTSAARGTQSDLQTARNLCRWLPEIPHVPLRQSYELTGRVLGAGGYGRVMEARKLRLPQRVAIKQIQSDAGFSESDQRRFIREVQLLAPLRHPNLVQIEDWGWDDDGLYIVMELIDGPNLQELVRREGRLPVPQLLNFASQICLALQCAHQQGIVHRDVKPLNLLLDPGGVVKLADFGLARESSDLRERVTSSRGTGLGTFAYASPEQLRGDQQLDGRSDLFSLGATLYHLASGEADTSRAFDLDDLGAEYQSLRGLFSSLLRPQREKRAADVAAVLQMISQLQHTASAGPALAATQPVAAVVPSAATLPAKTVPPAALSALVVPFSAAVAKSTQTALSRRLGQAEEWSNDLGMKFRLIPGGTFAMGSPAGQGSNDEHPQHKVTISRAFSLGVHTVTQGQWQQLMGTTPWQGQHNVKIGETIAATYISWEDSVLFCQLLSARDGRRYRLPTEAEWEWSCRAGTTTQYSFGDDEQQLKQFAWYGAGFFSMLFGSASAEAVGQKSANPFGLYDMHGNVWEWCSDWYDKKYYGKSPEQDPAGPPSGSSRVLRGGGWDDGPIRLRSCYRSRGLCVAPDGRNYVIGLRVLCELE